MIARIHGVILEVESDRVVIEAGGIGYLVLLPASLVPHLPQIGEKADLYIRHVIREDAQILYGFMTPFQRQLFDLLTEVKGCGPRIGLALIGEVGEQETVTAIQMKDVKGLSKASGVGQRLAERLILELKDKVQPEWLFNSSAPIIKTSKVNSPEILDDLTEALMALGYRRQEALQASEKAREVASELPDQIRQALLILKK